MYVIRMKPPDHRLSYASPDDPFVKRLLIHAVEYATGRLHLEQVYAEIRAMQVPSSALWHAALTKLSVDVAYDAGQLAKVPVQGPVVFVANHPFGIVDGLGLGYLVSRVRSEFVVPVNVAVCREERLAPFLLPIDFEETRAAVRTNIETRRRVIEHLRDGGALAIFPAGGVATSSGWWGPARDLEWKRFVAKVIQMTEATVVPIYFPGQNSRLFQVVSQFSLTLRLGLLLREVRNKRGRRISVGIGDPIAYSALQGLKDREALLAYLREVTYGLAERL